MVKNLIKKKGMVKTRKEMKFLLYILPYINKLDIPKTNTYRYRCNESYDNDIFPTTSHFLSLIQNLLPNLIN